MVVSYTFRVGVGCIVGIVCLCWCISAISKCFVGISIRIRQFMFEHGRTISFAVTVMLIALLCNSIYVQYALGYSLSTALSDLVRCWRWRDVVVA